MTYLTTPAPEEQYMLEGPCPRVCKSHVLLRRESPGSNAWQPVVYFRKPKYVTEEDYADLMKRMTIRLEVTK